MGRGSLLQEGVMSRHSARCQGIALFGLLVCLGVFDTACAAPSIEDFAAYNDFGAVTLSPDGQRIAHTSQVNGERALMVLDLANKTHKPILAAEQERLQIRWCRFKTARRLVCSLRGIEFIGAQPVPFTRLIAIDADGSNLRTLVQDGNRGKSRYQDDILDWRPGDPTTVYIELAPKERFSVPYPDVLSLDIETGKLKRVLGGRIPITEWYTDGEGKIRYGSGCRDSRQCEYIARDSESAEWRVLKRWEIYKDPTDFGVLGFGPGGNSLLVSEIHQDRLAAYQLDLADKAAKELVFDHPQVDVGGAVTWPRTSRLIGFWYDTDRYRREVFDTQAAAIFALVDKSLPGTINHLVDSARDDKLLLVAAHSDVSPPQFHLLDLERKSMSRLGAIAPAIAATPLAPMKFVKIAAADGVTIPGYLTVPPVAEPKSLPLVVLPHGGPHARDTWGFDPLVQFLASRGYAVLQMNFRGSTGYGRNWFESGLRQWGTVMVDDVNAATKWAIQQGIADPKRTCIVGWSFGGYAALMGAIREPELYRCVASIAGVTDLRRLRWQEMRYYGGRASADHWIGTDADELRAGSPLKSVAGMKAPVLLVHGTLDIQVDLEQSRMMHRAMEAAGKQSELVIIEDGDHSLSRSAWRAALYQKLEAFLAKNLLDK